LQTNILPPLKTAWTQPQFSEVDDFWQISLGKTFIPLADDVPPAPSNAYHYTAVSKMSKAFTRASRYYAEHGEDGLREVAKRELQRSAEEVRAEMRRNIFMQEPVANAATSAAHASSEIGAASVEVRP
jgi:hypothetical protein